MQEKMVNKISLAALLHDIGKIVYRADNTHINHSVLGKNLLEKYCTDKDILQAVAYHHEKTLVKARIAENHIAYIIYEADNIAAGADRREETDGEYGFDKYSPLESIFNQLNGKCSDSEKCYHRLRGLDQTEKINYGIPIWQQNIKAARDKYEKLLSYMENNFKKLAKENSKDGFISVEPAQLLKIMEDICSYMPSSTKVSQACDVSLYDHVKLTAAIANAMYLYFVDNNIIDYKKACFSKQNKIYRQKNMFLLVSGDMSGIQDFIYTISSAGALKSLRGRSFYLDMILEYIVDEVLGTLELNRCNLIYTGGGHFYLLAPNTQNVKDKLKQFKNKCNEWFLRKTGTSLYLEMGYQECSAVNFMVPESNRNADGDYEQIGEIFRILSNKLSQQKLCRYNQEQLSAMFDPASNINRTRDGSRECGVCHTSSVDKLDEFHGKHDGNTQACNLCNKLYDFGKKIISDKNIFAVIESAEGLPLPSLDGHEYSLLSMDKDGLLKFYNGSNIKRLYTKNAAETGKLLSTNLWVGDYITHILQQENSKDEKTADFEYLAGQSRGIKRLGVLRADVDRLGQTFATAFSDENGAHYLTLSRMASLSRQMSMFFKKYINSICAGRIEGENEQEKPIFSLWNNKKQARKLVIVYSGGDDVFVVGAWDEVLEFAVDLYQSLQRFTNGKITLSAGMAMLEHKYPISQMANIAGQMESIAKDSGRNRIALLDMQEKMQTNGEDNKNKQVVHCYEWQTFINEVAGEKLQFLIKYFLFNTEQTNADETPIGKGHLAIGKGQLYRLVEFIRRKINISDQDQNTPKRMNIVRFIYWLARLEPDKKNESAYADYQEVRGKLYDWLVKDDLQDSRQLLTAIFLVIYGIRDKNDVKDMIDE
ncbi:type III-A CRISPR-associated protein Cas10/Csm1 [Pectinatus frisingensis]|uniref:type III-A CRISPR-associated protein Cas10/Csm1 n=1 Tax=Pectinatus frisingensis TaxID=865 RepID=UPI0018C54E15|nr:type III-A CRISPR-associated protein Cas10/Csm1 [Pectinatus frisingensis]